MTGPDGDGGRERRHLQVGIDHGPDGRGQDRLVLGHHRLGPGGRRRHRQAERGGGRGPGRGPPGGGGDLGGGRRRLDRPGSRPAAAHRPGHAPGRGRRRPAPPDAGVERRPRAGTASPPARSCWPRSISCTGASTCTPARPSAGCSISAWSRWSTRTTRWPTRRSGSGTTTGWPPWSPIWCGPTSSCC